MKTIRREIVKKENRLQSLFVVKAAAFNTKYQNFIREFNAQKLAITNVSVSRQRHVINAKDSFCV